MFWTDYDTPDWTWVRDYIDVNDLIDAHVIWYEKINNFSEKKWYFTTYNVWTWKWTSVLEVIKKVEKELNLTVNYEISERRKGDIATSYCDVTKINSELWWKTKIWLEKSIKNSWNFYNKV